MCGIVAYTGRTSATPFLLEGLRRLEYRGYDSAGIAVVNDERELVIHRAAGKLRNLVELLDGQQPRGQVGIGHTRWATHGPPTDQNAHPHADCSSRICVVHNGIIENYVSLRAELEAGGHLLRSQTDTEVLAHLIEDELSRRERDPDVTSTTQFRLAVRRALERVHGTYAIAVASADEPSMIVGACRQAPLVVGIADDGGYLASDIPALLHHTRDIIRLRDGEVVVLDGAQALIYDEDGQVVDRAITRVEWDETAAEKGGYPHFVLKEIHEQPQAIRTALAGRIVNQEAHLPELDTLDLEKIERIYLVACGTSSYASMVAKYAWEEWLRLPVETPIASEFRYAPPPLDERVLLVAVSQSGETADTLAAMKYAAATGAQTVTITNVVNSSLTQGVDAAVYLRVGPEIGVVATKTFTGQLAALYAMGLHLAAHRGTLTLERRRELGAALEAMPERIHEALRCHQDARRLAAACVDARHLLFLGRGVGYPTALEGALKLKEISYIHAEGYPAGELKHGPIALVEPGMAIVALATESRTYEKVISNVQEVKARHARVVAIATEGDEEIARHTDDVIYVPAVPEVFSPMVNAIPMQLFAYYAAVERGCDVDQPRNLAKSVTVE
jgi:glucosamine--fructose-6-phosphate aminotransferase (isomerizing)